VNGRLPLPPCPTASIWVAQKPPAGPLQRASVLAARLSWAGRGLGGQGCGLRRAAPTGGVQKPKQRRGRSRSSATARPTRPAAALGCNARPSLERGGVSIVSGSVCRGPSLQRHDRGSDCWKSRSTALALAPSGATRKGALFVSPSIAEGSTSAGLGGPGLLWSRHARNRSSQTAASGDSGARSTRNNSLLAGAGANASSGCTALATLFSARAPRIHSVFAA